MAAAANGGQPGSRGGSGFGRRMILILTEGPRAGGEELGRPAGKPGTPSRQSGRGSSQLGNRRAATEQRLRVGGGTGQPGEPPAKRDRPPGRKLRRAMTLVETKANARRSVDGGSELQRSRPGLRCLPKSSLPKLKELSEFVNEVANMRHDPRAPWVGQTAFAHKGGMHVHAIDRVARSYEHINPESVGNFRRVLVSDMSGRTNILMKAKELGIKLSPDAPETREITAKVKELVNRMMRQGALWQDCGDGWQALETTIRLSGWTQERALARSVPRSARHREDRGNYPQKIGLR